MRLTTPIAVRLNKLTPSIRRQKLIDYSSMYVREFVQT